MKLTVLIPTYKRAACLRRCVLGLAAQTRLPDEIVFIVRCDDDETVRAIPALPPVVRITLIRMSVPGQVNALNAGLAALRGDIVAITDDDAVPRPDWLERIEQHFLADATIGGIGGRDWVHHGLEVDQRSVFLVGRIQWFGRIIGNHHIGAGHTRIVDILKGANMSYRVLALLGVVFDQRLRGRGAQTANDMAFSLAVQRKGWKLIYDPRVAVDHYPAPRFDNEHRANLHLQSVEDDAFNQYWALLTSMSPGRRQRVACVWQRIVGSNAQPGLFYLITGTLCLDRTAPIRWRAAERGRTAASRSIRSLARN